MMNDPTVMEASRVLAEQISEQSEDKNANVENAFRRIVLRKPQAKEFSMIMDYYNEQLDLFKAGKLNEKSTLNVGEYAHAKKIDRKSAAALMKTISLIYNLEEVLSKS
jgi:hypothetical protein